MNFTTEAPPSKFLCPLTGNLMSDPVLSIHGTTFERKVILAWLDNSTTCPVTGKPLSLNGLVSDKNLRSLIAGWKEVSDYEENMSCETTTTAEQEDSVASVVEDNTDGDEESLRKIGLIGCDPYIFQLECQARAALKQLELQETNKVEEISSSLPARGGRVKKPVVQFFKSLQKSRATAAA